MKYYLYDHIPGAWTGWTLAVLATGKADADNYMRCQYLCGNYQYRGAVDNPGKGVNCGAVAYEAQRRLDAQL